MNSKKLVAFICATMMLVSCSNSQKASSENGSSIYTPGTYTASAMGMGEVKATVTVDASHITDVTLDLSNETESIGQKAEDTFLKDILEKQSGDIDTVTGATITSNAVKEAVNAALSQAKGEEVSNKMTAGTYVETVRGSRSDIKVEVTVDETSIKEIKVLDANDSPYVSDAAIEKVPKQILDSQSLNVDGVTGATITSTAIISAVSNAIEEAGGSKIAFIKETSSEKETVSDENTDILVIGGGTTGLVSGIAAKTDNTFQSENDLNVTVIESNGFGGGTLALCGGYVASYFGTPLNEQTGNSWDVNELAQAMYDSYPAFKNYTDVETIKNILSRNADVINGLMARGLHLTKEDAYVQTSGSLKKGDQAADYTTSTTLIAPDSTVRSGDDGYDINGGGGYLAKTLTEAVINAGVNLEFETTAVSLLTDENGNVTGAHVETPHTQYDIHAKKVILTTGFANLGTYAKKYPAYSTLIGEQNVSDKDFAQDAVKALGGEVYDLAKEVGVSAIIPGYAGVLAHYGEEGKLYRNMNAIWVNEDGDRFMDETTDGSRGGAVGKLLMEQKDGKAYIIFDSTHDGVKFYDYLSKQGIAYEADTLEELAEKANINVSAFTKTISQYNKDAEEDGDTSEFATAKDNMVPVTKAPYYAVQVNAICTAGVDDVIAVNSQMQVVKSITSGEVIGNLYAAGGAASATYLPMTKLGLGSHVNGAFLSGAYAAESARDSLSAE